MAILTLLVGVFSAIMLLLYGVKTIQTGVERSIGKGFRRQFSGKRSRMQSTLAGLVMAVVLQSSAAVALLSVSFVSSGAMGFSAALAAVLGADLGSSLVVLILSFRVDWLVPILLGVGGWLYLKTNKSQLRQAGRILLGAAFILLSLSLLAESLLPIKNGAAFSVFAAIIERDPFASFLFGASLALVMHSSVAAILMCVTMANTGAISPDAGFFLVLGANFGSSALPIWLTRGFEKAARRVVFANFALRGSFALIALVLGHQLGLVSALTVEQPGHFLIVSHVAFNACVWTALPFLPFVEKTTQVLFPEMDLPEEADQKTIEISCLNKNVLEVPNLALASIRRELLRMSQILTAMLHPVMEIYSTADEDTIIRIREMDILLNSALSGIRQYVSDMPFEKMSKTERRQARDMTEIAIDLEAAGDVISKQLVGLAQHVDSNGIKFSEHGWLEILCMFEKVSENIALAFGVLVTDDEGMARQVIEQKAAIREMERRSRKKHFKRLRDGLNDSFESSDMHLETLRALKELNSAVAAISYPILSQQGLLLQTRLAGDT